MLRNWVPEEWGDLPEFSCLAWDKKHQDTVREPLKSNSRASGASLIKDISNYLLSAYTFYQSSECIIGNVANCWKAKVSKQRVWAQ